MKCAVSRDHRKLRAFELADALAIEAYRATRPFPPEERYGLTSQIRRAAVSVPTNIVEGCARQSKADYLKFLNIALGSLRELGYLCDLSQRLGIMQEDDAAAIGRRYDEACRVLCGLIESLRAKQTA